MIPAKTVREIHDTARIEEVVEEFVSLRKRGVNMIGLCPFHNERTPSFNVSPVRNIFKCFGCGRGGDSVKFLMEHENMSYPDALRWLARKYNIEIKEVELTPEQRKEQQMADSLYIVNEFAQEFYEKNLHDTDEGKSIALPYFKQRGLTDETIKKFGLGYALPQRDALVKAAQANAYDLELVHKAGLCSEDGSRDFFRDRVIFTIHGMSGKVAAFAGRTMKSDKKIPKYINSPETEIYIKNKLLYGAFQAKNAIRKQNQCILVEGYMDVISMHQAGIENVLASSGTALTDGQVALIRRQTENLILFYDADSAGFNAAVKGFGISLKAGLNVQIVQLPQGEDPDSFAMAEGGEAVTDYIAENAKDIVLFLTEKRMEEAAGDPIKKAALLRDIADIIAQSPDALKRSVYVRETSELLKVDMGAMTSEVNKILQGDLRKWRDKTNREARQEAQESGGAAADDAPLFPSEEEQIVEQELPRKKTLSTDEFQEKDLVRLLVQFGDQKLEKEDNITAAEFILADIEDSIDSFENQLYARIIRQSLKRL